MKSLSEAIQQPHFETPRQKALINILYSGSWARNASALILKPFGMSWQQYNLMRILRGQKGKPVPLKLISARMLDKQSNASRLVDKLQDKGWVSRTTAKDDKRKVSLQLTALGASILEDASRLVSEWYNHLGSVLSDEEVELLCNLLDKFRYVETNTEDAS